MRALLLTSLAVLQAGVACAQPSRDSTDLAKADTLRAHGDCKAATRIYKELIERGAQLSQAYFGRARCSSDLEARMDDLYHSIQAGPTEWLPRMARADQYMRVKMFERAEDDLTVAVDHATDTVQLTTALYERALCRAAQRRFDGAERDLRQMLAIDSTDYRAINDMGRIMQELGRYGDAEGFLRKLIEMRPDDTQGYTNMAFLLGMQEKHAEALEWFDKAEQHGEKHAFFYNNRGYSKFKTGDLKGALKDIDRSIDLDMLNSYAYRNRALVYFEMKENAKACTDLETALKFRFTDQFGPEVKDLYDQRCH